MSESPIKVTAPAEPASQRLELRFENVGDRALGGAAQPIRLELWLPRRDQLWSGPLKAALGIDGQRLDGSGGVADLEVATGWSAFAGKADRDQAAGTYVIELRSDDRASSELGPGAALTLTLPLAQKTARQHFDLITRVRAIKKRRGREIPTLLGQGPPVAVSIAAAGGEHPTVRQLTFEALTESSRSLWSLEAGEAVTLHWKMENREKVTSARLRGPFPGVSEIPLEVDEVAGEGLALAEGSLTVRAARSQVFVLEVSYPKNETLTKMVALDIFTSANLGSLKLEPSRVLPHGEVTAHWAAWGVETVSLRVDYDHSEDPKSADRTRSFRLEGKGRWKHGSGRYPFPAPAAGETKVTLDLAEDETITRELTLATWDTWDLRFHAEPSTKARTSPPLALAYAGGDVGSIALLSADGRLWSAHGADGEEPRLDLEAFEGDGWLSVASVPRDAHDQIHFLALQKLAGGELRLVRMGSDGGGLHELGSFDVPGHRSCTAARLVTLADRAYVVSAPLGRSPAWVPLPLSFRFHEHSPRAQPEPALVAAAGMELVAVDQRSMSSQPGTGSASAGQRRAPALLAFDPRKNDLLRFDVAPQPAGSGSLGLPKRAAAKRQKRPDVRAGVPLAVEGLLLVLGDGGKGAPDHPQDWVYDPQHDRWLACGHGLGVAGGVAAYRPEVSGEVSRRLFVIQGRESRGATGVMDTLTGLPPDGHLFAPDHFSDNQVQRPTVDYLSQRKIQTPDESSYSANGTYAYQVVTSPAGIKVEPTRARITDLILSPSYVYTPAAASHIVVTLTYQIQSQSDLEEVHIASSQPIGSPRKLTRRGRNDSFYVNPVEPASFPARFNEIKIRLPTNADSKITLTVRALGSAPVQKSVTFKRRPLVVEVDPQSWRVVAAIDSAKDRLPLGLELWVGGARQMILPLIRNKKLSAVAPVAFGFPRTQKGTASLGGKSRTVEYALASIDRRGGKVKYTPRRDSRNDKLAWLVNEFVDLGGTIDRPGKIERLGLHLEEWENGFKGVVEGRSRLPSGTGEYGGVTFSLPESPQESFRVDVKAQYLVGYRCPDKRAGVCHKTRKEGGAYYPGNEDESVYFPVGNDSDYESGRLSKALRQNLRRHFTVEEGRVVEALWGEPIQTVGVRVRGDEVVFRGPSAPGSLSQDTPLFRRYARDAPGPFGTTISAWLDDVDLGARGDLMVCGLGRERDFLGREVDSQLVYLGCNPADKQRVGRYVHISHAVYIKKAVWEAAGAHPQPPQGKSGTHLAATIGAEGAVEIYLNGESVARGELDFATVSRGVLNIFPTIIGGLEDQPLKARLRSFRIYKTAFSESNIRVLAYE